MSAHAHTGMRSEYPSLKVLLENSWDGDALRHPEDMSTGPPGHPPVDSGITESHYNMSTQSKHTNKEVSRAPLNQRKQPTTKSDPQCPGAGIIHHGENMTEHMTVMQLEGKLEQVP